MRKYNGLLTRASWRFCIKRGVQEEENDFKARVVYSICCMAGWTSLWDATDEDGISWQHLKNRIWRTLLDYLALYPELTEKFPTSPEPLAAEICKLFLNTGMVYHSPRRISPAAPHEARCRGVVLQRGLALGSIDRVSGSGCYAPDTQNTGKVTGTAGIAAMFGLSNIPLTELWQQITAAAVWKNATAPAAEPESYLRLNHPFSSGLWVDQADTSGSISLLRTGRQGAWLYYLYRMDGGVMQLSPLPEWQVEDQHYLTPACACLAARGTLPPIVCRSDGPLMHVRPAYLLPPPYLNLLKLYSWPEHCSRPADAFNRCLAAEVFTVLKAVLQAAGWEFIQGEN